MVVFRCIHCGQKLQARDDSAGRQVCCGRCRLVNQVPAPLAPSSSLPPEKPAALPGQPPGELPSRVAAQGGPLGGDTDQTMATLNRGSQASSAAVGTLSRAADPLRTQASQGESATPAPAAPG